MTAISATTLDAPTRDLRHADVAVSPIGYRVAGLAFATVLPAVFWVVVATGIGRIAGVEFSSAAMIASGIAIAAFLGSVCAPIMLKSEA